MPGAARNSVADYTTLKKRNNLKIWQRGSNTWASKCQKTTTLTTFTGIAEDVLSQSNASKIEDYNDLFDICFIIWIVWCIVTTLMIFLARGLLFAGIKDGNQMSLQGCKTFTIVINIVLFLFTVACLITEILVFTKGDDVASQDVASQVEPLQPFSDCSDSTFKKAIAITFDYKQEDFVTGLKVCSLIFGALELIALIVLMVIDCYMHKSNGVSQEGTELQGFSKTEAYMLGITSEKPEGQ